MVVARFAHGQLTVIDRLREMVRLASGLDAGGRLLESSQARALECLGRFGERLRDMRADRVRVVGTSTLRRARSTARFRQRAARALGHPVEVISGIEEGRLIYLGASHNLPRVDGPQLVIDIGGGSTEIILGRGYEPGPRESLSIGCVNLTESGFRGGRLSARNFQQARLQARLELEPVRSQFSEAGAIRFAGTSGSIRTAASVLAALDRAPQGITVDGLEHLIARMISTGKLADLNLPGLPRDRVEIFPGGIAILVEVMSGLDIGQLAVADGALREGLLYDMVGRLRDEDARARTVRAMASRYHVDAGQAARVAATAGMLFDQVAQDWGLGDDPHRDILTWAAELHELGLDIAHAHYHRHGAYVLGNADMPGFPREEQQLLACLVSAHRRKLDPDIFRTLSRAVQRSALRMAILLRLAVLFHRSRTSGSLPDIHLQARGKVLRLQLPASWLDASPLTMADLIREQKLLLAAGVDLTIRRR